MSSLAPVYKPDPPSARDKAIIALNKLKVLEAKLAAKGKLNTYIHKKDIVVNTFSERESPMLNYLKNKNIMTDGWAINQ